MVLIKKILNRLLSNVFNGNESFVEIVDIVKPSLHYKTESALGNLVLASFLKDSCNLIEDLLLNK